MEPMERQQDHPQPRSEAHLPSKDFADGAKASPHRPVPHPTSAILRVPCGAHWFSWTGYRHIQHQLSSHFPETNLFGMISCVPVVVPQRPVSHPTANLRFSFYKQGKICASRKILFRGSKCLSALQDMSCTYFQLCSHYPVQRFLHKPSCTNAVMLRISSANIHERTFMYQHFDAQNSLRKLSITSIQAPPSMQKHA